MLPAVDGVEGVIHVQGYTARHLPEAAAVQPDHGAGHPQQRSRPRQILKA
jgi:hypothetical protein